MHAAEGFAASEGSDHDASASGSAAGYLYQSQAALLELLRRAWEEPDLVLFLERLDDVGIGGGDAREALQDQAPHWRRCSERLSSSRNLGLRQGPSAGPAFRNDP